LTLSAVPLPGGFGGVAGSDYPPPVALGPSSSLLEVMEHDPSSLPPSSSDDEDKELWGAESLPVLWVRSTSSPVIPVGRVVGFLRIEV
jgi:hypothetical protein